MENKEMKKPILNELDDDALDNISGGLTTDSVSKDDTLGEGVPAILNPFDGYAKDLL